MLRIVAYRKAILAGVAGALVWEAAVRLLALVGVPAFDLVRALGTLPFPNGSPFVRWPAGTAARLAVGSYGRSQGAGFTFHRVTPGPDGPLWGVRESAEHRDEIYLRGFSGNSSATRTHKSSLVMPGTSLVMKRVEGAALDVLHTVVNDWVTQA